MIARPFLRTRLRYRSRFFSSGVPLHNPSKASVGGPLSANELDQFLAQPTWDVKSLLPTAADLENANEVTPAQLHHLLRLSALPQPASADEEQRMLRTLHSQLHFVRQVQNVDTSGVEPLVAIRDETQAAQQEETIGLESLRDALAHETVIGRRTRRIRRQENEEGTPETKDAENWDPLGQAPKRVGRFFVVDGSEV